MKIALTGLLLGSAMFAGAAFGITQPSADMQQGPGMMNQQQQQMNQQQRMNQHQQMMNQQQQMMNQQQAQKNKRIKKQSQQKQGPAAAGQGNIYGYQLMTAEERVQYRERIRNAKTAEERARIRAEHHKAMQERARERGITLPNPPPPSN